MNKTLVYKFCQLAYLLFDYKNISITLILNGIFQLTLNHYTGNIRQQLKTFQGAVEGITPAFEVATNNEIKKYND